MTLPNRRRLIMDDPRPDRRRFLALMTAWGAAPLCAALSGCSEPPKTDEAGPLRLPLDRLPLNERTLFDYHDRTVEIVRDDTGIRARVMLCTHQGCNISWSEEEQLYLCPCHDGRFGDDGLPTYGPPREPLRELAVKLTETEAIIGGS